MPCASIQSRPCDSTDRWGNVWLFACAASATGVQVVRGTVREVAGRVEVVCDRRLPLSEVVQLGGASSTSVSSGRSS